MRTKIEMTAEDVGEALKFWAEKQGYKVVVVTVHAPLRPVGYGMQERDEAVVEAILEVEMPARS